MTSVEKPEPRADEIVELCRLLVGADRERILAAIERLEDRSQFAEHLSKVLGDAMRLGAARDDRMAKAMAPLITKGVHETVQRDPGTFGEALAPAMGPAIRQSVRQMFQSLIDSFERTLEQSLSVRGWKWRFEAWRTGKTLAEVAFLHTLQYRAEHVFLIHRDTGLLLHHVSKNDVAAKDADLVSAMLTAIQDFVKDAFDSPEGDTLGAFQVGDLRVWVEQGSRAVLAVVLRGTAPQRLRPEFRGVLESIELTFSAQLADFDGDAAGFEGTTPDLERCLVEQQRKGTETKKKKRSGTGIAILVVLIAGLVWLGFTWFRDWRDATRWQGYVQRLREEPGIRLTLTEHTEDGYVVHGLRDPLAADPAEIANSLIGLPEFEARFEPFHSTHAEFVEARLRDAIEVPSTVTLELRDGALRLSGEAPSGWLDEVKRYARHVPAIERFHTYELRETPR